MGFPKVQKMDKSRRLFLSKNTPKQKQMNFWPEYEPDFSPMNFHNFFQKANMAKIMVNVQKRLKGDSVEADFWHGEKVDHDEKKLKIASFDEASLVVKLDCWNNKYSFANICPQVACVRYLYHLI